MRLTKFAIATVILAGILAVASCAEDVQKTRERDRKKSDPPPPVIVVPPVVAPTPSPIPPPP